MGKEFNLELETAVEKYADMVYRVCFLHLKDKSDAEDVFQEVFIKLMNRDQAFESESHLKAWLLRVAINGCRDLLRNFYRKNKVSIENIMDMAATIPEDYRDITEAVLALPNKYKQPIYLMYFEGYTAPEIGKILECPTNTVYTNLARGRKELQQVLGHQYSWSEEYK